MQSVHIISLAGYPLKACLQTNVLTAASKPLHCGHHPRTHVAKIIIWHEKVRRNLVTTLSASPHPRAHPTVTLTCYNQFKPVQFSWAPAIQDKYTGCLAIWLLAIVFGTCSDLLCWSRMVGKVVGRGHGDEESSEIGEAKHASFCDCWVAGVHRLRDSLSIRCPVWSFDLLNHKKILGIPWCRWSSDLIPRLDQMIKCWYDLQILTSKFWCFLCIL